MAIAFAFVLLPASGPGTAQISEGADVGPVHAGLTLAADAFLGGTETNPCPGAAAVRDYNVVAMRVPVSYNNWGDFDPQGRLFVLRENVVPLTNQVAARLQAAGLQTFATALDGFGDALAELDAAAGTLTATVPPSPDAVLAAAGNVEEAAEDVLFVSGLDADHPERAARDLGSLGRFTPAPLVQPFTVRAHLGECVRLHLFNTLSEPVSMQVAGVVARPGQGMALGTGLPDVAAPGQTRTYTVYIPPLAGLEGAHLITSAADPRFQTKHGMFGAIVAEPQGTTWRDRSGTPTPFGDQAIVVDPVASDFREFVLYYHDEVELVDHALRALPTVSPFGEYGPGTKAMNLRSEPFMDRFQHHDQLNEQGALPRGHDKSQAYGSYTYGDPNVFMPQSYLGDPVKFRLSNVGPGQAHVHHLHGGGIRWRSSPVSEDTQFDDGFLKTNPVVRSASERLDVQNMLPGEAFNAVPEGGSGGVQHAVGDFLFHCHIVEHYVGGMWSFWRVYNTKEDGLAELPDRADFIKKAVNAKQLVGKVLPGGVVVTHANIAGIVEPQLPPPGVSGDDDASVWDWIKTNNAIGTNPHYYGEPESAIAFPNYSPGVGRPELKFNPLDGKLAWPFMKPHFGERPPFAPDHGPAPYLTPDVTATQPKGLCPAGAPSRDYRIVAQSVEVPYNAQQVDADGQVFVHAADRPALLAPNSAVDAESLIIRANQGDCVDVLFTSDLDEADGGHSKVNMHIHLVQFDVQASDGVITGMSYEQSVRPADETGTTLSGAAAAGDTTIPVASTAGIQVGTLLGIGLTEDGVEAHKVAAVGVGTVMLATPLASAHDAGDLVGYEFVNYRWYPDVELGMVYWHDHVDGLNSWRHGLFGGLVVEPAGSQWCDPKRSDAERADCGGDVLAGHVLDIVNDDTANGEHYREIVVQVQDRGCIAEAQCTGADPFPLPPDGAFEPASFGLRSAPFGTRNGQYPFASWADGDPATAGVQPQGDPATDLLEAYPGDPVVVRLLYAGQSSSTGVGTFAVTGHRFQFEQHNEGSHTTDRISFGISSQHNVRLECGAGSCSGSPGDYLYHMSQPDMLRRGAWGVFRVHDELQNGTGGIQPLPSNEAPQPGGLPANEDLGVTGVREYDVVAMQAGVSHNDLFGAFANLKLFALASEEAAIVEGTLRPEPLVLRALPGEIVEVTLTNHLSSGRVSLSPSLLGVEPGDGYGIPVGNNADDTIGPGESRTYRWHADREVGLAYLASFGDPDGDAQAGLYGALVVEPEGSSFSSDSGASATLTLADDTEAREHVLLWSNDDAQFESSTMPYLIDVEGLTSVNYRTEPLGDRVGGRVPGVPGVTAEKLGGLGVHTCQVDVNLCGGDLVRGEVRNPLNALSHFLTPPETPIIEAVEGEPLVIRSVLGAGDQLIAPSVQGHWWALDPDMDDCRFDHATCGSNLVSARPLGHGQADNAWIPAAGPAGPGEYLWADGRMAFHEAGAWGIVRVCPAPVPVTIEQTGSQTVGTGGVSVDRDVTVEADSTRLGAASACALSDQLGDAFAVVRNAAAAQVHETVRLLLGASGDPAGFATALLESLENTSEGICLRFSEDGPEDGDTTMPPLAFLANLSPYPGFVPLCIIMDDGGEFTIHSRDAIPHNPGSVADLDGTLADRCFQFRRDIGGGVTNQNALVDYNLLWDYDGADLRVSIDNGANWRNCNEAKGPGTTTAQAVVPFRCDIHLDMKGTVIVEA